METPMAFGSHNLPDDPAEGAAAPSDCPLGLGKRFPFLRHRPSRLLGKAAKWGGAGVAAFYALACLKCIVIYIVVPAVAVWFGGSAARSIAEMSHERAEQPVSAKVPDPRGLPPLASGDAALDEVEDADAAAAR
jgi:hypothetical protein